MRQFNTRVYKGQAISFDYAGEPRAGVIERVRRAAKTKDKKIYFVVYTSTDKVFKSYHYAGMTNIKVGA